MLDDDEDPLDYPALVQDALRGVVRHCLEVASEQGLPGEHHFFVTYRTDAPGVHVDADLVARYPQEMTIVIQHQFRDLEVYDDAFAVTLNFRGTWRRLQVPWEAITAFVDPSVQFVLPFLPIHQNEDDAAAELDADESSETGDEVAGPRAVAEAGTPRPVPPTGGQVVSIDAFRKK